MNLAPWWEQNPDRLKYEYTALKHAGISYSVDEKASACGILRLNLEMPYAGESIKLIVTFPDLYPYFRFQVDAPGLDLAHHQNPFGKNLCLIGRGTNEWHTTDTVAGLLQQQLPRVIEAGSSNDKTFVAGKEQQQAEPLSEYYGYSESMIVLPGEWQVPGQYDEGTFTVSPFGPQGPFPERFIRGLMSELRSRDGKTLLNSDVTVLNSSKQQPLDGCWIRVQEPIKHCHQKLFLEEMISRNDFARTAPPNRIEGGYVKLWGVLFPEEVGWRTEGEGWIFLCVFNVNQTKLIRFDQPMKSPKGPKNKRNSKRKKRN
ncbi:MAG: hypothetical protein CME32_27925 [Gimesia sp.]|nr:hypothetical protein [Gimesia sp.]